MAGDVLTRKQMEELLDRLSALRVQGSSMGGPYVGIGHNSLTREILAAGEALVPLLIARLPDSSYDEAVYIVFILRELHALEAQVAVRRLQSEIKKRSIGRDLTLKMQVEYYLRDVRDAKLD
jgi:hypothetical protein